MTIVNTPAALMIAAGDMTADQLALPTSERVTVITQYGPIVGGRVRNGCQVFLNVPYGLDVPRWTDPQPLPEDYKYENREYTTDGKYCAQPSRDDPLETPIRDRLGQGKPTENPFFADIYVPSTCKFPDFFSSSTTTSPLVPVRVFIHGGFLQFGSTSGQHYNQQFFAAEHANEVRVLLGYRLSVLGFMAASNGQGIQVDGNYGFKDCWLGLEWVRDNISAFGGDPNQVHLSGLSGGGHVVHQLIHRAALLAPKQAPFMTACLHSNAILTDSVPASSRPLDQYNYLAKLLSLDPSDPATLNIMRDPNVVSTEKLFEAVQKMQSLSTFRGAIGADGWLKSDQMEFQRSGKLGKGLIEAGVKCVIVGDVKEEEFFYKTVHPCANKDDVLENASRYYPRETAKAFIESYPPLPMNASPADYDQLMGRILADGQVHLPIRLLAKDLVSSDLPVVRYTVEKVAERLETNGHVSHGSDLVFHHLRFSMLTRIEIESALAFHKVLHSAIEPALREEKRGPDTKREFVQRGEEEVLCFGVDGVTSWKQDWRWPQLRATEKAVRPDL